LPLASDIVDYLDPLTTWTAGTDLFYGPMPELPDSCVAVTAYAGESAAEERTFGPSLQAPQCEIGRFQVAVRGTVQATVAADALALHALLDGLGDATINGRIYFYVESVNGEPAFLKQDESQRYTYAASYRARKQRG
jgi:Bacteriophage minor capsid protein